MKRGFLTETYARVGWLLTTVALAIALVAGAWINYQGARGAVATLHVGQANVLDAARRVAFDEPDWEITNEELQEFLQSHSADGLRYAAVFAPDGSLSASAGEPLGEVTPPAADGPPGRLPLVEVDGRLRSWTVRPFRRPGPPPGASPDSARRAIGGRGPDGPAPTAQPGGRQRPSHIVMEFEPLVATELVTRARTSLILASFGAIILIVAALLFWKSRAQYDAALRQIEQQKRLSMLGEMSAVLAHEIRNPLASLKGHAQLLAEKLGEDTKERGRAERVVNEASRLEALTADLLDFARTGPLDVKAVEPAELLRTSAEDVRGDIEIDTAAAPRAWQLDQGRIRAALVNLLQNAVQASPAGQPPHATAALERGRLVYTVRDRGAGLPADVGDRIFEPFVTTRTNGTGLGLAVARRVIELHGGTLTAQNHPEGGALFRIELPPAE